MAGHTRRPRLRRIVDGPRRRTGPIRALDRTACLGHQQAAHRFPVRSIQLADLPPMKADIAPIEVIRQHLIDPEICIRCNTCEETCPVHAISHDGRNYVVDAAICEGCNACISPCPTGSIDNWRQVSRTKVYTLDEQLAWA